MTRPTRLIGDELYERCLTLREIRAAIRLRVAYWDIHGQAWRLTRHARLMRWIKGWV